MSKDLFTQMREVEIFTNRFLPSKKYITKSSKQFAKKLIDSGDYNLQEKYAEVRRLKEAIDVIESEFKKALPDESFEYYGLKATYRNGGSSLNYAEDEKYLELQSQLKHRESLLKVASESNIDFYDEEGVKVPKVSKTERKSSLSITF